MQVSAHNAAKYNYRPENPPDRQNWSEHTAYLSGEAVHTKAQATLDFFTRADNSTEDGLYDLDPREGFVHLRNTRAPGLLEDKTATVSGFMTDDNKVYAAGSYEGNGAVTTIKVDGDKVEMGRPVYINNRYMPTIETLTYEQDGSRTFTEAYAPWG